MHMYIHTYVYTYMYVSECDVVVIVIYVGPFKSQQKQKLSWVWHFLKISIVYYDRFRVNKSTILNNFFIALQFLCLRHRVHLLARTLF